MAKKTQKKNTTIENTFGSLLKMGFQQLFSISISGRISRGQLWISDMILRLWLTFILFLDLAIFSIPVITFVFLLLGIIKTIFLMVQRMNDLDLNQNRILAALGIMIFCLIIQNIWTLIVLILLLIAFQIYLYAIKGTDGSNQFGKDPLLMQPKTNEKYYIIVGILLFLIVFFGAIMGFFLGGLEMIGIGSSS